MPTNNQLRTELARLTDNLYAQELVLTKTNYKQPESNILLLKALVAYHNMCLVDELLSHVLRDTTNMSTVNVLEQMRKLWRNNPAVRTKEQHRVLCAIHAQLERSSIGRNQLIEIILDSVKENINV